MLRCSNNVQTRQFVFQKVHPKVAAFFCAQVQQTKVEVLLGASSQDIREKILLELPWSKSPRKKGRACPLEAGKANQRDRWIIAYMIFEGWNSDFLKWLDFGTWTSVSFSDILLSSPYQKGKSTWHRLTGDGSTVVPWLVEICKQTIMYSYILGISIHDQRLCFFCRNSVL